MRVEVLDNFYDMQMQTLHSKGDLIDITEERAVQIKTVLSGYIKIVEIEPELELEEEPEEETTDLNSMTKKELITYAESKGIKLDNRMNKNQMISELEV